MYVVPLSILSTAIFLYLGFAHYSYNIENSYWNRCFYEAKNNLAIVNSDLSWSRWSMPNNHVEYCILWFFAQDRSLKIEFRGEANLLDGIKNCIFEIHYVNDSIKQIINSPPFGKIEIVKDENSILTLEWKMSTDLKVNNNLNMPETGIELSLQSIIKSEEDWKIKLNNIWIKKGDRIPWSNVVIMNIFNNTAEFKVSTPKRDEIISLSCGHKTNVRYL